MKVYKNGDLVRMKTVREMVEDFGEPVIEHGRPVFIIEEDVHFSVNRLNKLQGFHFIVDNSCIDDINKFRYEKYFNEEGDSIAFRDGGALNDCFGFGLRPEVTKLVASQKHMSNKESLLELYKEHRKLGMAKIAMKEVLNKIKHIISQDELEDVCDGFDELNTFSTELWKKTRKY